MHARSEAARIAAIRELLDRAYGKPTQFLATDDDVIPANLSADEIRAEIVARFQEAMPDYRLLKVVPSPSGGRPKRQQTFTNGPQASALETSLVPKKLSKRALSDHE
jgi:hypothetical protein